VGIEVEINNSKERPMRLLNTSEGKAVEKNIVGDKISEEIYEALPGGH
jgi:hypothetical protein